MRPFNALSRRKLLKSSAAVTALTVVGAPAIAAWRASPAHASTCPITCPQSDPGRTRYADFAARRDALIGVFNCTAIEDYTLTGDSVGTQVSPWLAMAKFACGDTQKVAEANTLISDLLAYQPPCGKAIDVFARHGLIDCYFRYYNKYTQANRDDTRDLLTSFDYTTPNDQGGQGGNTDNQRFMALVTGYLAGQEWPTHSGWPSGKDGNYQKSFARERLFTNANATDWFNDNDATGNSFANEYFQIGMGEYNAPPYLTHYINTMLTLYQFANDANDATRAKILMEWFLTSLAAKWNDGYLMATAGRGYDRMQDVDGYESVRVLMWLYFDAPSPKLPMGDYTWGDAHWSTVNAVGSDAALADTPRTFRAYTPPPVLTQLASGPSASGDTIKETHHNGSLRRYLTSYVRPTYGIASNTGEQPNSPPFEADGTLNRWFVRWVSEDPGNSLWISHTKRANHVYKQTSSGVSGRVVAGNTAWTNYTVQAHIKALESSGNSGIVARYSNDNNLYWLRLGSSGSVDLWKIVSGTSTRIATAAMTVTANKWYQLKLKLSGTNLTGYVDNAEQFSVSDSAHSSGKIGLRSGAQSFSANDVMVTDLACDPDVLFIDDFQDGNAAGWTVVSGTWSTVIDAATNGNETDLPYMQDPSGKTANSWYTLRTPYEQVMQHSNALLAVFNLPTGNDSFPNEYIEGPFSTQSIYIRDEDNPGGPGWIFCHCGDTLLAIYMTKPYSWTPSGGRFIRDKKWGRDPVQWGSKPSYAVDNIRSAGSLVSGYRKNGVILEAWATAEFFQTGDTQQQTLDRFKTTIKNGTVVTAGGINNAAPYLKYETLAYGTHSSRTLEITFDGDRKVNGSVQNLSAWPRLSSDYVTYVTSGGNATGMEVSRGGYTRRYNFPHGGTWSIQDL